MFLQLLPDFYQYCDKEKIVIEGEHRQAVEEFACWLDEYTDSIAKEPMRDTLPSG